MPTMHAPSYIDKRARPLSYPKRVSQSRSTALLIFTHTHSTLSLSLSLSHTHTHTHLLHTHTHTHTHTPLTHTLTHHTQSTFVQSVCSVTCGRGTIRQNVTCIDPNNGNVLEDGYCDIRLRPADVVPCPLMINCQGLFCNKVANHAKKVPYSGYILWGGGGGVFCQFEIKYLHIV